jgi:hypothetical protein
MWADACMRGSGLDDGLMEQRRRTHQCVFTPIGYFLSNILHPFRLCGSCHTCYLFWYLFSLFLTLLDSVGAFSCHVTWYFISYNILNPFLTLRVLSPLSSHLIFPFFILHPFRLCGSCHPCYLLWYLFSLFLTLLGSAAPLILVISFDISFLYY